MQRACAIVLYGNLLSLAAVSAGLGRLPGWTSQHLDRAAHDAAARLRALHPDVVLFDLVSDQPDAIIPLLQEHPNLLLIGINLASHHALLLSGRRRVVTTSGELSVLIGAHLRVAQQRSDP